MPRLAMLKCIKCIAVHLFPVRWTVTASVRPGGKGGGVAVAVVKITVEIFQFSDLRDPEEDDFENLTIFPCPTINLW